MLPYWLRLQSRRRLCCHRSHFRRRDSTYRNARDTCRGGHWAILRILRKLPAAVDLGLFRFVPLLAMVGGGIAGGLFGYWAGAVFGCMPVIARWRPPPEDTPEQKAENARRGRWQIGFGCVGWFVGLMAGLSIFITLLEFVWGADGGLKVLLPVLFFGGGVTGIICGVVIGNRVARRRTDRQPNNAEPLCSWLKR